MPYFRDAQDKRRYERVPGSMVCRLRKPDAPQSTQKFSASAVINFSRIGVFIETPESFEKGEVVELELVLPTSGARLSTLASVRWCKQTEPRGVGLELIEVEIEDRERIEHYIEWQLKNKNVNKD